MGRAVMSGSGLRVGALVTSVWFCAIALPQGRPNEVSLTWAPAWQAEAGDSFGNTVPLRVEIDNPLSNDQGIVTVRSGTYRMAYPVELPAKSRRSLIVYMPTSMGFQDQSIELASRQGYIKLDLQFGEGYSETLDFGLISDTPALMRFVRASEIETPQSSTDYPQYLVHRDFAAKPGAAPDRAIGYEGLDLLVLSEGAERMTDAEVTAVQRYVLSGGTVVFTGGAVAPILRDERWSAFLPGTEPQVTNITGSRVLGTVTGVPMTQTLTITKITPAPGTTGLMENGIPMLWYRRCGLGTVVYWAFDPFVDPLRTYRGRSKLFSDTALAAGSDATTYKQELGVVTMDYQDPMYYYDPYASQTDSVFTVAMPSTSKLLIVLVCYFVVVVPINFVVLGKMKKGQLAWVTSPIIGLAFASVFFYVARDLYSTNLSRSTDALVVAHEGSPVAYALGKQQMFFPNGGRYDLGFSGMEKVSGVNQYYEYYGPRTETGFGGDLVDTGEVVAPRAGVSNLSFREFMFSQGVDWGYRLPLEFKTTREGQVWTISGQMTNDTPYILAEIKLWIEGREVIVGQIKPGQTFPFSVTGAYSEITVRMPGSPPPGTGVVAATFRPMGFVVGTGLGEERGRGPLVYYTYSSVNAEGA